MSTGLRIHPAVPSDAAGIAAVHVQAWREACRHLPPAEVLADRSIPARGSLWTRIIGEHLTDVCDDVIGWVTTSAGRDPDRPRPVELEGIYVLAAHHGTGAGQELLDAAIGSSPWVGMRLSSTTNKGVTKNRARNAPAARKYPVSVASRGRRSKNEEIANHARPMKNGERR